MHKPQYVFALSVHFVLRKLRLEHYVISFFRWRAFVYLKLSGLGHILDEDLSYKESLLKISDRTKIVDLARLHKLVKGGKFLRIREYGAGASTLVIADAILKSGRNDITLTTIEESEYWLCFVKSRLPAQTLANFFGVVVEYNAKSHSVSLMDETDLYCKEAIHGIPDFIYVDGPTLNAPIEKIRGLSLRSGWAEPINADFISVAHTMPKGGLILFDDRLASYWALTHSLRRPFWSWSSTLLSSHKVVLL